MPKALEPRKCLEKLIEAKVKQNKDKWDAGLPNRYFEWEELQTDILNQDELLRNYTKECSELRMANERLKSENERYKESNSRLATENAELREKYQKLEAEYAYLMNEPSDDENEWEF